MREERLFVAGRGRGWRDARRALARAFSLAPEPGARDLRTYHDTFDWRFYRAGLQLETSDARVALRDATTAEVLASGSWRGPAGVRYARDLVPPALRDRVAALAGPRALFEVARARVTVDEAAARDERGRQVARLRSETMIVRRSGAARTVRVLFVEIAKERTRLETRASIRRALGSAGYRPSSGSAYGRLLSAAGRRPDDDAPRPRVEISPQAPLGASMAAILRHLLDVMARNESGLVRDLDPEFLHDYRVALRRTRTALAEFRGVFTAEEARAFRSRFAALSGPTGRVRDVDVHLGRRAEYAAWVPAPFRKGFAPLFASLEREREARRAGLLTLLASPEYAALKRDWKRALAALASGSRAGVAAGEPALPAARAAVAKRYARLRAIAEALEDLDDAALHRARVQSKRLRYVLEFFTHPLGGAVLPAIAAVESLQDALGAYHDAGVFQSLLGEEAHRSSSISRDAVVHGAVIGALTARLDVRKAKARRRAVRRLDALVDRKGERMFRRLAES
ncbi:MAG TPA: CHAD domain-containing protein [Candidatus Krumholzibacteria bacterium]|nr:CHAD domain-containing protein [Candidatus Krumholzibacteria bacterium]